jgi:hypothetical protein
MRGHEAALTTAENYLRFAEEAAGKSPAYERLAMGVAADPVVLSFLDDLPLAKRQPNLLFAAARFLLGSPADAGSLKSLVVSRGSELAGVMRERRTQTNEAARAALLLPALATLPEPLALLEVGASAGLLLLMDHYSYDYAGHHIVGTDPEPLILSCAPIGAVPLPERVPEITWRAGIDANPLDAGNPADAEWLSCLLWPGEAGRPERLAAALAIARKTRPRIHKGDLLEDLPVVAASAPSDATLVVYNSAALAYIGVEKREAFAAKVRDLGAVWLSLEGGGVLPGLRDAPADAASFLLVRDGTDVLARADPHGTWLEWRS